MSKKYVMWGSYCDQVLEKRTPHRQDHLDNLQALKNNGQLITIGPTQNLQKVFAVYVADTEAEARSLIEADPYWQHQIWTEYEIYEWVQVF
ncbi:hypothetical protein Syn7502_02019 [Synechococcus sp. PCC 7502]|uniref:YciI family protein n=1 Tax=Synechococcus sp. PCC 7502 TaxID=1173263 RepID=UPI00029FAC1B|nr:YciI family protein [Synechococcus sp. PCC 7502]AFY74043.1 hypothetical protein Syn7502_02019 [Synechococcus sp. PCC 7502]